MFSDDGIETGSEANQISYKIEDFTVNRDSPAIYKVNISNLNYGYASNLSIFSLTTLSNNKYHWRRPPPSSRLGTGSAWLRHGRAVAEFLFSVSL